MPSVVVVGGVIQCSHGGMVKLMQGDGRLEIGSNAAVVSGMEANLSFASGPGLVLLCPNQTPAGTPAPCTGTLPATAGVSTLLTVENKGVLLDNAQGDAVNTQSVKPPTWSVLKAGQKLLSVSE
jgi:hypothetical protein